jgi:hypothetical protein
MREHFGDTIDAAVRQPRGIEPLQPHLGRMLAEAGDDDLFERIAVLAACFGGLEARVVQKPGTLYDLAAGLAQATPTYLPSPAR